ncbi:iron complex outermembrane receptor protein [Pseudoduganella lurida]|uniref:Iron complex outermembrane receptor protein n=1 Tax=Pseudoduganella lurida TaxID=1036180 RepID=A0A562RBZ0_9BURK|nr:TonB-dependent receptor [Pseudoduganella lurida]TWI66567.1 iron complex outermembrane receptor protein [Pseudoduganella lurida]
MSRSNKMPATGTRINWPGVMMALALGARAASAAAAPAVADTAVTDAVAADAVGADAADPQAAATSAAAVTLIPPNEGIEKVIVTAEKRRVNLQETPLAVTVISSDALDKANVVNLAGLNGQVPGLSIAKSGGYETVVTVRGIGSETPQAAYQTQPGVSLHVDGVYIANSISLDQSLFDLDHIEVLRGPQGTVSGMASTGGTINLVSKQPELGKWGGSADVTVGNYHTTQARGALNVPLGETTAIRASLQKYDHDGFARSTYGFGLDEAHDASGKLAFLWKPNPDFSATLTGQWYRANQNGAAQKNILDPNPDPRTLTQDYRSRFKLGADLYHLNLEYSLPWATLKSITSSQRLDHKQQMNGSRLDYATLGQYDNLAAWNTKLKNYTQEFSIASVPGGAVDWTAGVFGMRQDSNQYVIEFGGTDPNPDLTLPPRPIVVRPYNLYYSEDTTVRRKSWAAFTQATWHVSEQLRLTAGARYNHDASEGGTRNWLQSSGGKPTGKLEADYDLTKQNMVYASLTRGYKPGGINNNPGSIMVSHHFLPESINAFEVGSKNQFLNNKLRLNLAAFYYDYRNLQYLANDPNPYQGGIANVPKVHTKGLEAELSYLALENRLRVNGNVTYLRGKVIGDYYTLDAAGIRAAVVNTPGCESYYTSYPTPACAANVATQAQNLNGNSTAKTPKWQGSVNVSYAVPLESGLLTPRVEYIYRGKFIYRMFNNSTLDQVPNYGLVNLHVDYSPHGSDWSFSMAASNIGNKDGINSRFTDPYGIGQTSNEYVAPRQITAKVAYSF